MGGDLNDSDVSRLKKQVEEQEAKLAELQAKLHKPPKAMSTKKGGANQASPAAAAQGRNS